MNYIDSENINTNNNLNDYSISIPLFTIFIIFIYYALDIIPLLPCKIQKFYYNNIYYRHISCIMIIIFVMILEEPIDKFYIKSILLNALYIYILILLLTNTHYYFFMTIFIIMAITYLVHFKKNQLHKYQIKNNDYSHQNKILYMNKFINIMFIIIIVLIIIGLLTYYGQKKHEYQNKFNIFKFIFGTKTCKFTDTKLSILESLKYAFSK
jgi:hypothetical protein